VSVDGEAAAVTLVDCDKFTLRRYSLNEAQGIATNGTFQIVAVLSGVIRVASDPSGGVLRKGDTMLVPACVENIDVDVVEAAELMVASA
jgi:mannose-6-phosphate isomerase class I